MRRTVLIVLLTLVSACSEGGPTVESFCEVVQDFDDQRPASGDLDLAAFAALVEAAPNDIRADMARVSAVLSELDALGDSDADYARAAQLTGDADFIAAGDRVEEYLFDRCEVALSGNGSTVGTIPPISILGIDDREIGVFLETEFSFADEVSGHRIISGTEAIVAVELSGDLEPLVACIELAVWIAGHPDADGELMVLEVSHVDLDDDGVPLPGRQVVRNGSVRPGNPGLCVMDS